MQATFKVSISRMTDTHACTMLTASLHHASRNNLTLEVANAQNLDQDMPKSTAIINKFIEDGLTVVLKKSA